jgi:hypothetical protein
MVVNNVPPDQLPRLRANPNLRIVTSPTNRRHRSGNTSRRIVAALSSKET